ncbi:MAG: cell envelope integrity protein CreD [Pseudomonadota bacterium]
MNQRLPMKLAGVALLCLLLMIPLTLIRGMISERASYRAEAEASIAASWTSAQAIHGPVLVQPYRARVAVTTRDPEGRLRTSTQEQLRHAYRPVDDLAIDGSVRTELRRRGIYAVPVYTAALTFSGSMDVSDFALGGGEVEVLRLEQPYLAIALTDSRGLSNDPRLAWDGREVAFEPGSGLAIGSPGIHVPVALDGNGSKPFRTTIALKGMASLRFAPTGRQTRVALRSAWEDPSFDGRYLPEHRPAEDGGFNAVWAVSRFASNVEAQLDACASGHCAELSGNLFGVRFIDAVDVYLQAERSVKYGLLFIVLNFVSFLLLELLRKLPVHPIQYALVGAALAIFYLLLIALSEHVPFALAYAFSAAMCVGLLVLYLRHLFASTRLALTYGGAAAALYGMLYVILQSEDHALLMGSLLLFGALALVMFATRRIDWYETSRAPGAPQPETVVG